MDKSRFRRNIKKRKPDYKYIINEFQPLVEIIKILMESDWKCNRYNGYSFVNRFNAIKSHLNNPEKQSELELIHDMFLDFLNNTVDLLRYFEFSYRNEEVKYKEDIKGNQISRMLNIIERRIEDLNKFCESINQSSRYHHFSKFHPHFPDIEQRTR